MSNDVARFIVSAPFETQLKGEELINHLTELFGEPDDHDDDGWFAYDHSERSFTPFLDVDGVAGVVYTMVDQDSYSGLYHTSSLTIKEVSRVLEEMKGFGVDMEQARVASYIYYNGTDNDFRFNGEDEE